MIENEIIELILQRKYFYGYFLQQFRRYVTRDVSTMAVNITSDLKPNLYINPDFYESLTQEQRISVLEHEVLHILNKHLVRVENRNHYVWNLATDIAINQYIKGLPNGCWCPDCHRIVQKIGADLPKVCDKCQKSLDAKRFKCEALQPNNIILNGKQVKLPDKKSSEVYYDLIWNDIPKVTVAMGTSITQQGENEKKEKMGGGGNGEGEGEGEGGINIVKVEVVGGGGNGQGEEGKEKKEGSGGEGKGQEESKPSQKQGTGNVQVDGVELPMPLDDHDAWSAGSDNKEMEHEKIKDMVQKSVQKMQEHKSQGHIPSHLQSLIDACLAHKTLTWKTILRRFVGYEEFAFWKPSRKRLNKRFPMMMGSVVEMKAHMLVCVDTSGSISDEELAIFFSEIGAMYSAGVKITIVECDADVQQVFEYRHKKQRFECKGRGGTDFRPPFELAHKGEYKNHRGEVFTLRKKIDGIIYLTDGYGSYPSMTRFKTLWVYTPNHSDHGHNPKLGDKVVIDLGKTNEGW